MKKIIIANALFATPVAVFAQNVGTVHQVSLGWLFLDWMFSSTVGILIVSSVAAFVSGIVSYIIVRIIGGRLRNLIKFQRNFLTAFLVVNILILGIVAFVSLLLPSAGDSWGALYLFGYASLMLLPLGVLNLIFYTTCFVSLVRSLAQHAEAPSVRDEMNIGLLWWFISLSLPFGFAIIGGIISFFVHLGLYVISLVGFLLVITILLIQVRALLKYVFYCNRLLQPTTEHNV